MVYRPFVDPELCFVLIPFKEPFLEYYEEVIKVAAGATGLKAGNAGEVYGNAPIIQDIWRSIWKAAIVIADVTDRNPNVNYELGICHALGVPTILITQRMDDVPFDYRHRRCILYDTSAVNWDGKLRDKIAKTIRAVLGGEGAHEDLKWPYETDPNKTPVDKGSFLPAARATQRVIEGANLVARTIARAFGPHGSLVSMKRGTGGEQTQRSGAVMAEGTRASEELEAKGIAIQQRAAREMHSLAGDGTKTVVLLTQALLEGGYAAIKRGHRQRDIVRCMDAAVESVTAFLGTHAATASSDDLLAVASAAATGDISAARCMTEAFKRVGKDGLVYIDEGPFTEIVLEVSEGMFFDRGAISAEFFRGRRNQEIVLLDSFILIHERKISTMKDLLPLLELIARTGKPLLIVAEEVEGEALATLLVNNERGSLLAVAVKAPGFADRRKEMLEDLAVLTGGIFVSGDSGLGLSNLSLSHLGRAQQVTITKDTTFVKGGGGSEDAINARADLLRRQIEGSPDTYGVAIMQERLAKLRGAVAAVRAGGLNESVRRDRKYKLERAMYSCREAISTGVLAGGGIAALHAAREIRARARANATMSAGTEAVAHALCRPAEEIVRNSGGDVDAILGELEHASSAMDGFDAESGTIVNMRIRGILDPAGTWIKALKIAFSHAREVLETGAWSLDGERDEEAGKFSRLMEGTPTAEPDSADSPDGTGNPLT
jgi:chaperonin GroEL